VLGEVGPSRFGQGLHALGEPDRVAHGRVLHVRVVADGADDDLARVETDAGVEAQALRAAQLLGVAADGVGEMEGGVTGPAGVILVGHGGAEEGHDPVAGELVHRSLEAVDAVTEDPHEAVHEPVPLLGVEFLLKVHRPLHVGEEDGDLLALAFQGRPGGPDLLDEVLRGGGQRRRRGLGRYTHP
jgi:hypothetical protein